MMVTEKHPCPCCGYPTLTEPPPGTFEVCPVCFWEDDDSQFRDPEYAGGANTESLVEARENFARFGAISESHRAHVRPPTDEERASRASFTQ
jgi:hypothetical protein